MELVSVTFRFLPSIHPATSPSLLFIPLRLYLFHYYVITTGNQRYFIYEVELKALFVPGFSL